MPGETFEEIKKKTSKRKYVNLLYVSKARLVALSNGRRKVLHHTAGAQVTRKHSQTESQMAAKCCRDARRNSLGNSLLYYYCTLHAIYANMMAATTAMSEKHTHYWTSETGMRGCIIIIVIKQKSKVDSYRPIGLDPYSWNESATCDTRYLQFANARYLEYMARHVLV